MGYNANLMRTGIIPARSAAATVAIAFPIIPAPDQRVTIPYLRLKAGVEGGNLAVLQTEAVYKFSLKTNGTIISIQGIPAGLSGRHVVVRFPGGETKDSKISAQAGEAITLVDSIQATEGATLYIIGTASNANTILIPLAVSGSTVLQSDCPGVVAGKELGWPVVLYLENTDGDQKIEGGAIAYIGV